MNKTSYRKFRPRKGFTLAELITSLVVGSMVMVVMLSIYNHAERTSAAITRKVESSQVAADVLQLIAEDIDRLIDAGSNAKVSVENKFDSDGYSTARLTIEKFIYNKKNRKEPFEKIVWQSDYDYNSNTPGLVLYRSHTGMVLEDKLLDEKRADWENDYSFVPICRGVTYFRVQVPRKDEFYERWTRTTLPPGIVVTISFAEPSETVLNTLDVPEEEKVVRSIAIDRSKNKKFKIVPLDLNGNRGREDPNQDTEQSTEELEDEGTVKPDTQSRFGRKTKSSSTTDLKSRLEKLRGMNKSGRSNPSRQPR